VCNHTSGIDSIAVIGYTPASVKFIMKQELLYMNPFMFGLAWMVGHIPINRSDHKKAVASIAKAAQSIKRDRTTVAIYPEGTRSKDGKMQPFKKGAFHLALESDVPIIPVRVSGSHALWSPSMMWPHYSNMKLTFYPPIAITKDTTVDSLLLAVRKELIKAIDCDTFTNRRLNVLETTVPCLLWISFASCVCYWYFYILL
jgi:1-acyl-sn-glycerol-3-phosphate acyltransferase